MTEGAFFQDLAVMMSVVGAVTVVFSRFGWPKVIGWILAGVLMSPHTWGGNFLVDSGSITTFGQLGIVFLMFALGLEFSVSDMKRLRGVVIPTAAFDLVMMMLIGYGVGVSVFGWGLLQSVFLGACICDSATTLLSKTIEEMKWSDRPFVKYIFGTTICEDILCVGVIALITGMSHGGGVSAGDVAGSLGALAVFFVAILVIGLSQATRLINSIYSRMDDETLLLIQLGLCFFVSWVAFKLQFSLAMGAFLIGIIGASSMARDKLHELVSPLRSMFSAVFFVTIGLLVDPMAMAHNWMQVLAVTLVVMVGKFLNCFVASVLAGQNVKSSVQTGMGLAQIGEFAYMVALMYVTATGSADAPLFQIVVGASLVSTCLNPLMLRLSDPVGDYVACHVPVKIGRWLEAYWQWLEKFKSGSSESHGMKRLKNRLVWLVVVYVVNVAIAFAAGMLSKIDWSAFSRIVNGHKGDILYVMSNLLSISLLAPIAGLGNSIGRNVALVVIGGGGEVSRNGWRGAAVKVGSVSFMFIAIALGFVEMFFLNLGLMPESRYTRICMTVFFVVIAVIGWGYFKRLARRAGYGFNRALAEERHRGKKASGAAETITVPHDFHGLMSVTADSPFAGHSIKELDIRARTGASIVAIIRAGVKIRNPSPATVLLTGDQISAIGKPEQLARMRAFGKGEAQK